MNAFTGTWAPDAERNLANMYGDNPLIRKEISVASDRLEGQLSSVPLSIGVPIRGKIRNVVYPPLSLLLKQAPTTGEWKFCG